MCYNIIPHLTKQRVSWKPKQLNHSVDVSLWTEDVVPDHAKLHPQIKLHRSPLLLKIKNGHCIMPCRIGAVIYIWHRKGISRTIIVSNRYFVVHIDCCSWCLWYERNEQSDIDYTVPIHSDTRQAHYSNWPWQFSH